MKLGNLDGLGAVPVGSPPSSYAGYDVVTGKPGAIPVFAFLTVVRAVLIAPGLYASGVRGRQLAGGALLASAGVSAFVLAYTRWNLEPEPQLEANPEPPPAASPDDPKLV